MEKIHNERGAGRKPLPDDKKMIMFRGGFMPPYMIDFLNRGIDGVTGIKLVRSALDHLIDHHNNSH